MQTFVTTSVTEAECVAATSYIQEMQFGMQWLEALGLKVEKPMTLWMDNKGSVDLFNSWSINRRTRAFVRFFLKEQGMIVVKWFQMDSNYTDFFTKNIDGNSFAKQTEVYCGQTMNQFTEVTFVDICVSLLLHSGQKEGGCITPFFKRKESAALSSVSMAPSNERGGMEAADRCSSLLLMRPLSWAS